MGIKINLTWLRLPGRSTLKIQAMSLSLVLSNVTCSGLFAILCSAFSIFFVLSIFQTSTAMGNATGWLKINCRPQEK